MKSIVGEYGTAVITALMAGILTVLLFGTLAFDGRTGISEIAKDFGEKIFSQADAHVEEANTLAIRQVYQRGVAEVKFKGEERILCNQEVNLRNYFTVTNAELEEMPYTIEDILNDKGESLLYEKSETGEKTETGNPEKIIFTKIGVYQVILEAWDGKGIKRSVQVKIPVGR